MARTVKSPAKKTGAKKNTVKPAANGNGKAASKKVRPLRGWLTAAQAAPLLGASRATVARMYEAGELRTIRGVGERPMRIARIEEVKALREARTRLGSWDAAFAELKKSPLASLGLAKD